MTAEEYFENGPFKKADGPSDNIYKITDKTVADWQAFADETARIWARTSDSISDSLASALLNGENAFKYLANVAKSVAEQILSAFINKIFISPFTGGGGGGGMWLSLALCFAAVRKGRDGQAVLFSSAVFLSLWGVVGAIQYPNLVRAKDPALSLTVANASSSPFTLKVMLIIALVGMPLVVGYTVFAYRVFKGKVRPGDGYS